MMKKNKTFASINWTLFFDLFMLIYLWLVFTAYSNCIFGCSICRRRQSDIIHSAVDTHVYRSLISLFCSTTDDNLKKTKTNRQFYYSAIALRRIMFWWFLRTPPNESAVAFSRLFYFYMWRRYGKHTIFYSLSSSYSFWIK